MAAREIEARLKISAVERTASAFAAVENRLKKVDRLSADVSRKQRAIAQSERAAAVRGGGVGGLLAGAGGRMAAGLTVAGVGLGAASALKDYAALERQMTRIGLAAGATDAETKAATASVGKLAFDLALPLDKAVSGLDALVATGKTMPEALAFLPSILRTAQATGAATEDMAASANALATSLKVPVSQMQGAFDALVVGGQLGQFELKDMARYLPSLTASAAKLGFTGQEGVEQLVAMLQTVRQVSGTSEEAATAVRDSFERMLSPTVANAFKKQGIDIGKVLEDAAKGGKNQFEAVIETLNRMTKGMSETKRNMLISSIFTESDSRRAVVAMMTLSDAYERYQKEIKGASGATEKNLQRVLADSQASVDRLSNAYDRLWKAAGRAVDAAGGSRLMDTIASGIDSKVDKAEDDRRLEAGIRNAFKGKTWQEYQKFRSSASRDDLVEMAKKGGYEPSQAAQAETDAKASKLEEAQRARLAKAEEGFRKVEHLKGTPVFLYASKELDTARADFAKTQEARAAREKAQAEKDAAGVPTIPGGAPLPPGDPRHIPPPSAPVVPLPLMDPRGGVMPPSGPDIPLPLADPRRGIQGASAAGAFFPADVALGATPPAPQSGPMSVQFGGAAPDALRQAMEGAGPSIAQGGASAADAVLKAAMALERAASRIGEEGQKAAEAISSARITVPAQAGGRGPNANLGQSMPDAGTPGG